jgi:hypothetical protein
LSSTQPFFNFRAPELELQKPHKHYINKSPGRLRRKLALHRARDSFIGLDLPKVRGDMYRCMCICLFTPSRAWAIPWAPSRAWNSIGAMAAIAGMEIPCPRWRPWTSMDLGRPMDSMDLGRPMDSMENGNLPEARIPWKTAIYGIPWKTAIYGRLGIHKPWQRHGIHKPGPGSGPAGSGRARVVPSFGTGRAGFNFGSGRGRRVGPCKTSTRYR